jgi:hypothetical protein
MINHQFGNYKFHTFLGEVSILSSYFAGNVLLDTYLTVKVLKVDFISYQNFRSQFLDNSKKIARVKHQDRVEIVTDCLKGNSLKKLFKKNMGKGSINSFVLNRE